MLEVVIHDILFGLVYGRFTFDYASIRLKVSLEPQRQPRNPRAASTISGCSFHKCTACVTHGFGIRLQLTASKLSFTGAANTSKNVTVHTNLNRPRLLARTCTSIKASSCRERILHGEISERKCDVSFQCLNMDSLHNAIDVQMIQESSAPNPRIRLVRTPCVHTARCCFPATEARRCK